MTEYIKKSDAEAALLDLRKGYRRVDEKCAVGGCILEIRDLPAEDVEPVKHAEWIPIWDCDPDDGSKWIIGYQCSSCDGCVGWLDNNYNYCPYCGAKMDLRGDTE